MSDVQIWKSELLTAVGTNWSSQVDLVNVEVSRVNQTPDGNPDHVLLSVDGTPAPL